MTNSKKPLPVEEQTMLLTTLLFARTHLDEILSFLPEEKQERMHSAKLRFLELEQSERVRRIILELRRLLLIKENNIRWIHKSWIEEELSKEPAYLQPFLRYEFGDKNATFDLKDISNEQVIQSFLKPFLSTPQKIAIFDPVLMRLQSLNRTNQAQSISKIGRFSLRALRRVLNRKRFILFIKRNFSAALSDDEHASMEENPMALTLCKELFLKLLLEHKNKQSSFDDLCIESGLLIIAFYLSAEKPRWHRRIELVLARNYGLRLRFMLNSLKEMGEELPPRLPFGNLLIEALEDAFV